MTLSRFQGSGLLQVKKEPTHSETSVPCNKPVINYFVVHSTIRVSKRYCLSAADYV